jgi:glucuronoarabinoxylan endo-1,4-beta-xylanase
MAVGVAGAGCFSSAPRPDPNPTIAAVPVAVDLSQQEQTIDGFGASSAWTASTMTDARADELFSPSSGIGLSLLRVRIAPDGTTGELATAQKAIARGAKVWATPWSPPIDWKSGASMQDGGGAILATDLQPWADRLAAFAKMMSDAGAPLLAISAQNEPNYGPTTYESCLWAPGALVSFVRDNLGPSLAAAGVSPPPPVMAPETANWTSFDSFASAFVMDSSAMKYVGLLATHAYGGSPHTLPAVVAAGARVWQTEYGDQSTPLDVGMGSAIKVAQTIHQGLVNGNVNAWHYWWINPSGVNAKDNSSLVSGNVLTRRAYVLGNWAKFVRPGFVRVAATFDLGSSVMATAFTGPDTGRLVIVVVNSAQSPVSQTFTVAGGAFDTATPWVTSPDVALAAQDPVAVADGGFSYTVPARSVTTFVLDPSAAAPDGGATD